MLKHSFVCLFLAILFMFAPSFAQEKITLPAPKRTGGMPLMEALDNRRSSREFSQKEVSPQILSDMLWATWGINRPDGRRTAPTARNWQALDVYVIRKDGVFRYNAQENALETVLSGDYRRIAGGQEFAQNAPLNLLIVADLSKMGANADDNRMTANIDAGFLAQNTYLFAASQELNCVARMMINRDEIRRILGFGENKYPVIALTVGH